MEHVEAFVRDGVVVVPGVLSAETVAQVRAAYHATLLEYGVDAKDLDGTACNVAALSSTGGSGGVLDLFYEPWKLALVEHAGIVRVLQTLWTHTYATNGAPFEHPFGEFDPQRALAYVDRTCFRLPERVNAKRTKEGEEGFRKGSADSPSSSSSSSSSCVPPAPQTKKTKKKKKLQRSLTPHLDCCPQRLFDSDSSVPKWRPIQAFVALTDTLLPNQGGFEACPGMHRDFQKWAQRRRPSPHAMEPPCKGDFTPIRPQEDRDILDRMTHIAVAAGDVCLWDYRLAHGNAWENTNDSAREAVYVGLLPHTAMNEAYAACQLECYKRGSPPTDQWHESDRTYSPSGYSFSVLGRKLMAMESW